VPISAEEVGVRLARNGRPVVEDFGTAERLYFRVERAEIEPGGQLRLARVRVNQSVNRGAFSRAGWVLHPDHWDDAGVGVAECAVASVSREIPSQSQHKWACRPVHDPLDANYAHSEIRVSRDGAFPPPSDLPNSVKIQIRTVIRDFASIAIKPGGGRAWLADDPGE